MADELEALEREGGRVLQAVSDPPPLVLASTSPRRRELLARYGFAFQATDAPVEESVDAFLTVPELVRLNANLKSASRVGWQPGAVVLGVDTLVCLESRALGKPRDRTEAAAMLARLAGRTHQVYSGVSLRGPEEGRLVSFVEETRVTFLPLTAEQIAEYHDLIDPLDKAGAYAAQSHGERIIAAVDGSRTNVMGLPMERLAEALEREFGIWPGGKG